MTEQFVKKHAELWKFIKFNISVLVTSAIDILSYLVLLYFVFKSCNGVELGDNALLSLLGIRYKGYLYSYLISTALGYISAYLINRRVTFHSDVNPLYSSVLYIVLAVFNILVSSYIGSVFGTYMSIHNMSNPITEIISKFVIINIPTLWTYPLERYVIQINKPKKKKVIRYIASDLDGTLISSDNEVSEENLDAIDRMHNAGDMNNKALDETRYAKYIGRVDLLKVGHHGYPYSTTAGFLKKLMPKYAVVCNSKKRVYSHIKFKMKNISKSKIYYTVESNGVKVVLGDGVKLIENIM